MTNKLYINQKGYKYPIHFLKNPIISWNDCHSKESQEKLIKLKKILEDEQSKITNEIN